MLTLTGKNMTDKVYPIVTDRAWDKKNVEKAFKLMTRKRRVVA